MFPFLKNVLVHVRREDPHPQEHCDDHALFRPGGGWKIRHRWKVLILLTLPVRINWDCDLSHALVTRALSQPVTCKSDSNNQWAIYIQALIMQDLLTGGCSTTPTTRWRREGRRWPWWQRCCPGRPTALQLKGAIEQRSLSRTQYQLCTLNISR